MDRLRPFLHRVVAPDRLADREAIAALGFRGRWVPEELAEFDEIELARSLTLERDLLLAIAVEQGKVARILVMWAPADDDDADAQAFSEEELSRVLDRHGSALGMVLAHLTA